MLTNLATPAYLPKEYIQLSVVLRTVFLSAYVLEWLVKLAALGVVVSLRSFWFRFDTLVISLALVWIVFVSIEHGDIEHAVLRSGFVQLRYFRLLPPSTGRHSAT